MSICQWLDTQGRRGIDKLISWIPKTDKIHCDRQEHQLLHKSQILVKVNLQDFPWSSYIVKLGESCGQNHPYLQDFPCFPFGPTLTRFFLAAEPAEPWSLAGLTISLCSLSLLLLLACLEKSWWMECSLALDLVHLGTTFEKGHFYFWKHKLRSMNLTVTGTCWSQSWLATSNAAFFSRDFDTNSI